MMALEDALLEILVCPIDKRGLLYFADDAALYNPRLRRLYRPSFLMSMWTSSPGACRSCCPSWPYQCPTRSTTG